MTRKRARVDSEPTETADEPINPVYPYDDFNSGISIMPPFYNTSDFQGSIGGTLTLKVADPLQKTASGLSIKLGDGLAITSDGKLTSSDAASFTATAPLYNENGKFLLKFNPPFDTVNGILTLNIGQGLEFIDNELAVSAYTASSPLNINNNNISLSLGQGLQLSNNNELSTIPYNTESPLTLENHNLKLNLGSGFFISNNALALNINSPFQVAENKLSLTLNDAMAIKNNALTFNISPPLYFFNNMLHLQYGAGLTLNSNILELNPGDGLQFSTDDNSKIGLNAGPGLKIENNQLQLNIGDGLILENNVLKTTPSTGGGNGEINPVSASSPLQIENQIISLNYNNGLTLNNNNLQVLSQPPLTVNASTGLNLNIGSGLVLNQGALCANILATPPISVTNGNTVKLSTFPPLRTYNTGLGIEMGSSLIVVDDALHVHLNATGPLNYNYTNSELSLNIGYGLSVTNGALVVTNSGPEWIMGTSYNDDFNNVPASSSGSGVLHLNLHKVGNTVNGIATFMATSQSTDKTCTVILRFNPNGTIDYNASDLKKGFGWINGPNVVENNGLNPKLMLPNQGYYREASPKYSRQNVWHVGYRDYPNNRVFDWVPTVFTVGYNKDTDSTHPFSITLSWETDKGYNTLGSIYAFTTSMFAYIPNFE